VRESPRLRKRASKVRKSQRVRKNLKVKRSLKPRKKAKKLRVVNNTESRAALRKEKMMLERPSQGHKLLTVQLRASLREREHQRRRMVKAQKSQRVMVRKQISHALRLPNQSTERRVKLTKKVPLQEMEKRLKEKTLPKKSQRTLFTKTQWNSLKRENSRTNGRNTDMVNGKELERHTLLWKLSFHPSLLRF